MDSTSEQAADTLRKWTDSGVNVGLRYEGKTGITAELSGRLTYAPFSVELLSEGGNFFIVELEGTEKLELITLKIDKPESRSDSTDTVVAPAVEIHLSVDKITIFEWIDSSGLLQ
jgi:hypothetical protein